MECFEVKNLSFTYPNREKPTLSDISFGTDRGEFITLCGKSGCGKTTLLRLLKSSLSPFGSLEGEILFNGKPLGGYDTRTQAAEIGFVMQSPDNQIVCDKVWHELAFGLESLGVKTPEIRTRVSEMASFFGIQTWFHKKVTELSGGQKQLLNLASVMVMQPSVLILDEPTSQLDPIAAGEFLNTLKKINRELGTTVILTEHRLEEAFSISDRVIVMDSGRIIADSTPRGVGRILGELKHDMCLALPAPMRIYSAVENGGDYPLTVREGKDWLEEYSKQNSLDETRIPAADISNAEGEAVIEIKDIWFRYEKNLPDIIKGLSLKVKKGEMCAIVGGNGAGKSTALSVISGINTPYRGKVLIKGKAPSEISGIYDGVLGVLPQNPQALFVKKTVYLDLMDMLSGKKLTGAEKEEKLAGIARLCRIEDLLEQHPYDLSGGEQQRAALAKVLLKTPEILLLDEPTKGMDAHFKEEFADILNDLMKNGVTILMVSHDIEFCAEYAQRCALMFDGGITSSGAPREFFKGKSFYTTSANRMARTSLPDAVLASDIILACGKTPPEKAKKTNGPAYAVKETKNETATSPKTSQKLTSKRILGGIGFLLVFVFICIASQLGVDAVNTPVIKKVGITAGHIGAFCMIFGAFVCFFPGKEFGIQIQQSRIDRKLTKRTVVAMMLILIAIPLTIFTGVFYFQDKKYYFISLLIIIETLIPFCMVFESRKPQARELIIISVLCAIAVAGRAAFFMLPQFKPVVAIVIICGVCFGGETGFLVGAICGFVSNFFFGQGPWTPWQMFAFGIIGFAAGVLFRKGFLRKTRLSLCIFGGIATLCIYGGIMNPSSVIMMQSRPTAEMLISAYLLGLPFDLIHAASTVFFLWFISEPMIDKLERIKVKYGLIES